MTRTTQMLTAGFLGLASLFGAGQAQAGDVKVGVEVRTGNGSLVFNSRGVDFRPEQPRYRDVIERVWVPARYEERHTQVLVERGHYVEQHNKVLVQAGYFQEVHKPVLVERGHYEERHNKVLVERGHYETRYTPPVYNTVRDRYGRQTTVLVKPGCHEKVWVPDRYETQCVKVWVPDRFENRCEKIWVPDRYETQCVKVWVPDRYETRCEKVLVAGHWTEVRRTVRVDDDRGGINIRVATRDR